MPADGAIRGCNLKTVQAFQISELAVLALRIDLFHRSQALRIAEVTGHCELPVHPIFEACIVEIPQRPAAGRRSSRVAEGPGARLAVGAVGDRLRGSIGLGQDVEVEELIGGCSALEMIDLRRDLEGIARTAVARKRLR